MNLKIRTYNPKLTIKENAEANNVNELAIKRYIKRNGIDRQGERLTTLLDGLIKAYKKDPTLTVYQFANANKKAPQTIKKYWPVITGEMTIEDFKKEYHLEDTKIAVADYYNYYATHPSVTRDLLRVESFHNEILEPFCGGGFMSREMFEHPDPKLLEIMERERKSMGLKTRKERQKELREMLAEVRRIHADGVRQRAELDARLNEQKDTPTIEELKRTNAELVSELERLKKER